MRARSPRNSVTWHTTMALRRTRAPLRSEAPLGNFVHSFSLGCMLSFCPFLRPCPSARFRRFSRGSGTETRAPLPLRDGPRFPRSPRPPRTHNSLFISVLLWRLGLLFVQVPPRSREEFSHATCADPRGQYPSSYQHCFGFFPPLHLLQ